MHLPTSPVVKWHGKSIVRRHENEHENVEKAAKLEHKRMGKRLGRTWFSRYAHRLISTPNTREMDGLTTMEKEIEHRDWKWPITSGFVPSEYHQRPSKAPWRIAMRCLLVDLPSQVNDNAEPIPWKSHPSPPGVTELSSPQEVRDKSRSLTGAWLVIVYISAKDRKWLAKADERTLITKENLYQSSAYVKAHVKASKGPKASDWYKFWDWSGRSGSLTITTPVTRYVLGLVATSDKNFAKESSAILDRNVEKIFFDASFERQWPKKVEKDEMK
ncbi:hypothetical protein QBC37DRAFT_384432 [Rhypophila decipiens]|uniref:Uncharacterized protein n=1 Tax=Rhypophila decipiens TaxID=261697 RepID=A0AAN6YDW2_9PEZI|nr:hypothetical protein QBC37DRAFT_384432 [Rhypophila decipiens]